MNVELFSPNSKLHLFFKIQIHTALIDAIIFDFVQYEIKFVSFISSP